MSRSFPHPFSDMARRFRRFQRELPSRVSDIAVDHFRKNFQYQGLRVGPGSTEKWEPRKDNTKGAGRAILVKTGRLRRSLKPRPTHDTARVVASAPYAAIHNRGGRIRGRERAWATSLRSGRTALRHNPGGAPATMPARPFMRTTILLERHVRMLVSKGLREVFETSKSE